MDSGFEGRSKEVECSGYGGRYRYNVLINVDFGGLHRNKDALSGSEGHAFGLWGAVLRVLRVSFSGYGGCPFGFGRTVLRVLRDGIAYKPIPIKGLWPC